MTSIHRWTIINTLIRNDEYSILEHITVISTERSLLNRSYLVVFIIGELYSLVHNEYIGCRWYRVNIQIGIHSERSQLNNYSIVYSG